MREYGIGRHRVYCHYPREVVRIPEPTEDRPVIFLHGSGVEPYNTILRLSLCISSQCNCFNCTRLC